MVVGEIGILGRVGFVGDRFPQRTVSCLGYIGVGEGAQHIKCRKGVSCEAGAYPSEPWLVGRSFRGVDIVERSLDSSVALIDEQATDIPKG